MPKTAILIDGGFFFKRYRHTYGPHHTAEQVAKNLFTMCLSHLDENNDLYRILFYDCPPLSKKAHNPITLRAIDFSQTPTYRFRTDFHKELLRKRKLALRLGRLNELGGWVIKSVPTKELLANEKTVSQLTEDDVEYEIIQKGVDMRIGLDIAALAFKRLVERIVLVAGDADFVPAAKLARREGIDFILDPMWQRISEDLREHIDGLKSVCPKPAGM